MPRDWSNHRYIDKYKSAKTGKWVYVYQNNTPNKNGVDNPLVFSNSRKGMTKKERDRDTRKHRAYNKKRMGINAKRVLSNLGKAAKAVATGKDATKYIVRSKKSAWKVARNATNLATSYAGRTGKRTRVKAAIEKHIYKDNNGRMKHTWNPNDPW